MHCLNRLCLLGRLGADAEVSFTPGGASITKFNIATDRRWKNKDTGEWQTATDWHRCVLWRHENIAQYLRKGTAVYVEGRSETRSYDKDGQTHYSTQCVVEIVSLLGGSRDAKTEQKQDQEFDNGDVPF